MPQIIFFLTSFLPPYSANPAQQGRQAGRNRKGNKKNKEKGLGTDINIRPEKEKREREGERGELQEPCFAYGGK